MTKIAIIADIHSNLPALEAVCSQIDYLDCREIFCLGDIVGYGSEPSACVEIVRQREMICIQGNHDAYVATEGNEEEFSFNFAALQAVFHNRTQLNKEQIGFLKGLPENLSWDEKTMLVHGSPDDRDKYLRYDVDLCELASDLMKNQGPGLIFFGHTHTPMAHNGVAPLRDADGSFFLDPECRMFFNPGSVGQPRDGDARAAFMVWDRNEGIVTQHRVAYDTTRARESILSAGLPHQLGDRLLTGR
jgi:predicted phosphodiesterase